MVEGTATQQSQRAPAYSASAEWSGERSSFRFGYDRSFIPSFGFGGTVRSQELGVSYHTALFNSRRFYTNQSAMFRDNAPLIERPESIKLRSFRTNSTFGWTAQRWARLEVFYSRMYQTRLRPGGRIDRNRFGIQIVTSKPMRMQ
jgi:hypothetical protein